MKKTILMHRFNLSKFRFSCKMRGCIKNIIILPLTKKPYVAAIYQKCLSVARYVGTDITTRHSKNPSYHVCVYLARPQASERSPRCFLNLAYVLRLFCLLSRSRPTKSRRSKGAHSRGTLPVASCE